MENENDTTKTQILAREEKLVSYVTMMLLLVGTGVILRFLKKEFYIAYSKKQKLSQHAKHNSKKLDIPICTKACSWSDIVLYRMDSYFSRSRWAKFVFLLNGTFLLIVAGAGLLTIFSEEDVSIYQSIWLAWTYVADPGTHADAEGYLIRIISIMITLGGMLIFALVIGLVSDEIGRLVDILDKGTSRCIEDDHTLMLGWTDKSIAIIQEIALANSSEGGGVVVVLAEADKQEMEATLLSALQMTEHPLKLYGTEVIFRSGNPLLENQLHKVSVLTSRAIIALSPDGVGSDEADSRMVRQVLCLKALQDDLNSHVVVEMQDIDNKELVEMVAPNIAEVVVAHDMIGRLMVQCAREPELAAILESLLGFDGSEFYFENWPTLVGKTFGEITCRFDDAVPIGVKVGATDKILINPENSYLMKPGDALLCLAEDNDSYSVNDGTYNKKLNNEVKICVTDSGSNGLNKSPLLQKEKLLFCGWRRDMYDMIMQLEHCVAAGSELWLFNSVPAQERVELLSDMGNKDKLELTRLSIKNVVGSPLVRRDLRLLAAVDDEGQPIKGETITLDCFDSILILADGIAISNGAAMQSSDSQSLVSLLIIQDIQKRLYEEKLLRQTILGSSEGDGMREENHYPQVSDGTITTNSLKVPCNPISEILDTRTRGLLEVANCKGYVMSNQMVSAVIAQVAEERDMNPVLGELLSGNGSELFLQDVTSYLSHQELEQQLSQEQLEKIIAKAKTSIAAAPQEQEEHNESNGSPKTAKKKTKNRKKKNSTSKEVDNSDSNNNQDSFSFWDIASRARLQREVAIGYKPKGRSTTEARTTILNPNDKYLPRRWEKGDKIVVLSRNCAHSRANKKK